MNKHDPQFIARILGDALDAIAGKVFGHDGPYDGDELFLRIEELVEAEKHRALPESRLAGLVRRVSPAADTTAHAAMCAIGLHVYREAHIRYDPWPDADTWVVNERCACGAMRDQRYIGGLATVSDEMRAAGIAQMFPEQAGGT